MTTSTWLKIKTSVMPDRLTKMYFHVKPICAERVLKVFTALHYISYKQVAELYYPLQTEHTYIGGIPYISCD